MSAAPDILETRRLLIRAFEPEDLAAIHRILDQTFGDGSKLHDPAALQERRSWLEWSALNQKWLPALYQLPYGDRAIILKSRGALIGAIGYVPLCAPFAQIPELRGSMPCNGCYTPDVGLFWAIDPLHQRQGYAAEAAQALIENAFRRMRLKRILATTEHSNLPSQKVIQRLGMTVTRNPLPEPPWLQIVGVLENPAC